MSLSPSPPPPTRPARRFVFKRANLAVPDTTASTSITSTTDIPDTTSFFSRREQNYTAPEVAKKQKQKQKRPIKKKSDGSPPKRARGSKDGEVLSGDDQRRRKHVSAKQRCDAIVLSDSDGEGDGDEEDAHGSTAAGGRKHRPKSKPKPRKREVSLTPPPVLYIDPPPSRTAASPPAPTQRCTTIKTTTTTTIKPITLDSSDTEMSAPAPVPAPISADDALFATLEKRAREKAAARNQQRASTPTTSTPPPDAIISVLITSAIEHTQPLVLRLRATQALKAARTTWCQRQGFSADQAAEVFLTWRGNKVFDHNSCRGMGIVEVGGEENVHLEAVTAEGFAKMERERERAYMLAEEEEVEEAPAVEKEEVVMRLTLRRKGVEDFKIKVRPETKISKLIAAYRIANKVPDEKEVRLDFDGDDLDPEDTIGDTELEDLFGIDVYVS